MSISIEKVGNDADVSRTSRASKMQALMDYMNRADESSPATAEAGIEPPSTDTQSSDGEQSTAEADSPAAEISAADMAEIYAAIQQQMTGSKPAQGSSSGSSASPVGSAGSAGSVGQSAGTSDTEEILALLMKLLTSLKSQNSQNSGSSGDQDLEKLMQMLGALMGGKSQQGMDNPGAAAGGGGGGGGNAAPAGGAAGTGGPSAGSPSASGPSTADATGQANPSDSMDMEKLLELLRMLLGGQKPQQAAANGPSNAGAGNGSSGAPPVGEAAKTSGSDMNANSKDLEKLLSLLEKLLAGLKAEPTSQAAPNGGAGGGSASGAGDAGGAPDASAAPDAGGSPDASGASDAGDAPDTSAASDAGGESDASGASDTSSASDASGTSDTGGASDASDVGSSSDASQTDLEELLELLRSMLGVDKKPQQQPQPPMPSSSGGGGGGGGGSGGPSPVGAAGGTPPAGGTGSTNPSGSYGSSGPSGSSGPGSANPTTGTSTGSSTGSTPSTPPGVSPLTPSGSQSGGPSVKSAAAKHGMYAGGAVDMGQLKDPAYQKTIKEQYNVITAENSMKWGELDKNGYGPADQLVDWASKNDIKVRGHALVWHEQAPDRIQNMGGPELQQEVNKHITDTVKHFGDKVNTWDVVNETFSNNAKGGFRSTSNGDDKGSPFNDKIGGQAFLDSSFKAARAAGGPNKELVLNDYNVETKNAKSDSMYEAVKSMKERGIPIDAVGFQGHVAVGQDLSSMEANIKRFKDLGVKVQITELDVKGGSRADKIAVEKHVFDAAAKGGASGVSFWGVSDAHSWIGNDPGLIADKDMKVKDDLIKALSA
jgi:endo-1,4-beta-xylanase